MPAAAAIPAIVGGVGAIAGGVAQRGAATSAGNILERAGNAAADSQLAEGERGANQIVGAGQSAADLLMGTANTAAGGINSATQAGQQQILNALAGLNPYSEAGQAAVQRLMAGLGAGGEFANLNPNAFMNDAGVNFRINQGMRAIENSAVSRGTLGSNTARGITDYAQGVASEEYSKAHDRAAANRAAQINALMGLSTQGLSAAGQNISGTQAAANLGLEGATASGGLLTGAAQGAGNFGLTANTAASQLRSANTAQANDFRTSGASGQASAAVGRGNALANMFGGLAQTASQTDWGSVFRPRGRGGSTTTLQGGFGTGIQ